MTPEARVASAIELVDLLIADCLHPEGVPAEKVIRGYLRTRRFIGSKDRRWLQETVWSVMRHWGRISAFVAAHGDPEEQKPVPAEAGADQASIAKLAGRDALILWSLITGLDLDAFGHASSYAPDALSAGEAKLVDAFQRVTAAGGDLAMVDEWPKGLARNDTGLIASLLEEAPVDIRLRASKDGKALMPADLKGHADWAPIEALPLARRSQQPGRITELDSFKSGAFEIQDAASQIGALLLGAKPGEAICDLCAGAGGKTLAIADHMTVKGSITAFDIIPTRLKELETRAQRAGIASMVKTRVIEREGPARRKQLSKFNGQFDRVIIDAPCSGSGTWRRNPDLKWRTSADEVKALAALQAGLIADAVKLVRAGGVIAYLTCSVFEEENEAVVRAALDAHEGLEILDYRALWDKAGVRGASLKTASTEDYCLQMRPDWHQTDGFFVACLRRSIS